MRTTRGFTTVECLVVVAIIALLLGILIPVIKKMRSEDKITVISPSGQVEKQETFPSGQTMTRVPRDELETYLSKIGNKRIVTAVPEWRLGGTPSHYLVITEPVK